MEKTIKSIRYKAIIIHMAEIRKKAYITQCELEKRIGEPQSFISKYERLERKLDINEMLNIFNALGISDEEALRTIVQIRKNNF